jgi:membrane-associated phospholipid phosphatase
MNAAWLLLSGAGLAIVGASVAAARHPSIPDWEMHVFRAVNGLPEWLYRVVWLPMQLGNLVVGTAVGLVCALAAGKLSVAVGVVLAMVLKLVTERFLRHRMHAYLTVRVRPGTSEPGAVLRGDVPSSGASFPSGHVILVTAIGCVVAPTLPGEWITVPLLLTLLVMVGRVYVAAHNPLDVTAGLGAGLVLGGALAVVVG